MKGCWCKWENKHGIESDTNEKIEKGKKQNYYCCYSSLPPLYEKWETISFTTTWTIYIYSFILNNMWLPLDSGTIVSTDSGDERPITK